jgi:potassium-transporting ATPase potassium-binding subunit
MVRDTRQGWALFAAMSVLFLAGVFVPIPPEQPAIRCCQAGHRDAATATQPGGNMEGKETRFGIANSALFATVTTDASCGAVNNACTTASRRSAGWCRWSTSNWAKWFSEASARGSTAC